MRDNVKKELDKFGKNVIKQSRNRLTRSNSNASKSLYNSLSYDLSVGKNSFSLSFEMEDYGEFIDKGVSGKEKTYNTPFAFKSKRPPANVFESWSKAKGIKPRDKKTGRFITKKAFGFIMAEHVFRKGIKPTEFFTKSFETQFNKLSDDVVEAFNLDLDDFIKFSLDG